MITTEFDTFFLIIMSLIDSFLILIAYQFMDYARGFIRWMSLPSVSSSLLVIATFFLTLATFQLVFENERLGDIADAQRNISENQKNIMENQTINQELLNNLTKINLELLRPNLKCWWNSTPSGNGNEVEFIIVNLGQLPGEVVSVSAIYSGDYYHCGSGCDKDILTYVIGKTPSYVITSGNRLIFTRKFESEVAWTKINTADDEVICAPLNQSTEIHIKETFYR